MSPVQRDDIRCLKNLVFWVWKHQLSMMLIGETSKSCLKAFGRRLHITSDFLRCLVFVLYIFSGVHSTPPPPPKKKKKRSLLGLLFQENFQVLATEVFGGFEAKFFCIKRPSWVNFKEDTQMLNAWYIYLHLSQELPKCR